jgi:hypothetical protein
MSGVLESDRALAREALGHACTSVLEDRVALAIARAREQAVRGAVQARMAHVAEPDPKLVHAVDISVQIARSWVHDLDADLTTRGISSSTRGMIQQQATHLIERLRRAT